MGGLLIYLSILIANVFVQIPNIWAISAFDKEPSIKTALYIALMCLPASFVANVGFCYYYGTGFERHSYPVLAVMAIGISFILSILIQSLMLKSRELMTVDLAVSYTHLTLPTKRIV